uniref:Uncharacterized protein n=1 Tax=viral metagenome TaxID=1070528 RepID=A0A6C0H885_9ZZZZ
MCLYKSFMKRIYAVLRVTIWKSDITFKYSFLIVVQQKEITIIQQKYSNNL